MSSLVLTGSTSGTVSVQAPAVAGSNTATLAAATGTHYPFTAGTAVASTSGTSIDFTGIPSWVKRITVMLSGVSLSGSSTYLVQIGAGSVTSSGYSAGGFSYGASLSSTAGIPIYSGSAARLTTGLTILTLVSGTTWVASAVYGADPATAGGGTTTGTVTLGGTLDRIRITTVNGTDTFDAGSINILYE